MATFEEWRTARGTLDEARKQLKVLVLTLSNRSTELLTLSNQKHGQQISSTHHVSADPSIQPLSVWPTEKQITDAVSQFNAALAAEDQAFNGLSVEDRKFVNRP